jgi:hypothetical protein
MGRGTSPKPISNLPMSQTSHSDFFNPYPYSYIMVYCNNCGAKNPDGSSYCSSCGSPLQPATSASSQPRQTSTPTQQGEQVYASISGLSKGFMGRENYLLLITHQQLMFVKLDSKDLTEIVTAAGP